MNTLKSSGLCIICNHKEITRKQSYQSCQLPVDKHVDKYTTPLTYNSPVVQACSEVFSDNEHVKLDMSLFNAFNGEDSFWFKKLCVYSTHNIQDDIIIH